jgi:hypothetical protein
MTACRTVGISERFGEQPGVPVAPAAIPQGKLSIAELRDRLSRMDEASAGQGLLTATSDGQMVMAARALARRVERFNRTVPPGLRVSLSPHVAAVCAMSTREGS